MYILLNILAAFSVIVLIQYAINMQKCSHYYYYYAFTITDLIISAILRQSSLSQVFAIEVVTFVVDFIPLAVEFGVFAVDFVGFCSPICYACTYIRRLDN